MANAAQNQHNLGENDERWRNVQSLRELFHGRFSEREAETIINHFHGNFQQAVNFGFEATQAEIEDVLGNGDGWQLVIYVRQHQVVQDLNRRYEITKEIRQFSCGLCNTMWWRKVPTRKMVSKCRTCKKRKKALPRDKEWGWARFNCVCGNEYHHFGAMDIRMLRGSNGVQLSGKSKSLCFRCNQYLVEPTEILPPRRRPRRSLPKGAHCTAYNCYKRYIPTVPEPIVPVCVHPRSLPITVLVAANSHTSTGSTVDTFMSQDDLITDINP
ncbi:hypothetical protein DPMN_073239 [Dreissena polymorpha]|uniref:Uncharacterized protein n=2 Tax=Dreissena polymorpha TaxID=45954 RepID=A0A9D4BYT3_DREPO|nr:hypothetical protein DPMN_073239 [Dreissena polymorpha]